jgi:hypothetical protein
MTGTATSGSLESACRESWLHVYSRGRGNHSASRRFVGISWPRLTGTEEWQPCNPRNNRRTFAMKTSSTSLPILALAAAVISSAASVASGGPQCKPVVGNFEAQVVTDGCTSPVGLCTAGRVWGGIQSNYAFTMASAFPNGESTASTVLFFTGHSLVTLKTGDVILGTDTGAIDLPPGQGGFASLITFHPGGTGATTNATGQIRLRGDFNPIEGTTSGDYLGTICSN